MNSNALKIYEHLIKGLEKDDIHIILKGMAGDGGSRLMNALRNVEKELESA